MPVLSMDKLIWHAINMQIQMYKLVLRSVIDLSVKPLNKLEKILFLIIVAKKFEIHKTLYVQITEYLDKWKRIFQK